MKARKYDGTVCVCEMQERVVAAGTLFTTEGVLRQVRARIRRLFTNKKR
jgi:hypothetical protein